MKLDLKASGYEAEHAGFSVRVYVCNYEHRGPIVNATIWDHRGLADSDPERFTERYQVLDWYDYLHFGHDTAHTEAERVSAAKAACEEAIGRRLSRETCAQEAAP